ncbi:MAG: hypothetical protein G01um101433_1116 [Parcubacteria group bacterium Gr01-1014_33]|nr:MAG: hypothetical protein G01um101433_1116 [Parcubacteria group bacterium Gr01-1014_33]
MQQQKANSFEIIARDARVEMKCWGETLQELFLNAVKGMAYYIKPSAFAQVERRKKIAEKIFVEAVDINSLLIEFLSEVIARADIRSVVFTEAVFERFGENFLEGEITGIEAGEYDKTVGGVSYEDVEIKKDPKTERFEAVVSFL